MLYHVIEKQPDGHKTRIIKKTNDYDLANKLIEDNSNYYIKYDKSALDKINTPKVKFRKQSPMETFHVRPFPNMSTEETKKKYYDLAHGDSNG